MVNGWDSNLRGRALLSCPWKNISKMYSRFVSNIRYETRQGNKIRFLEDLWWGDVKFCQRFQWIYPISNKKGLPISYFYFESSPSSNLAWDLGLRRGLRDFEIDEVSTLCSLLSDIFIDPSLQDSRNWSLSSNGCFSPSCHK